MFSTRWQSGTKHVLQCGKQACFDIAVGIGIANRNCACKQTAQDEALNADFGPSTATASWHSEFRGLLFRSLGATSSLVNLDDWAGG